MAVSNIDYRDMDSVISRIYGLIESVKRLARKDPENCLNSARQIAEAICMKTLLKNRLAKEDKLPGTLEAAINMLGNNPDAMDRNRKIDADIVRNLGNEGSHFRVVRPSRNDVKKCLISLDELVEWFWADNNLYLPAKYKNTADEIRGALHIVGKCPKGEKIFCGRDRLIEDIHAAFNEENRIIFLRGMGGIGKSEIVKHYAQRFDKEYDAIVFGIYEGSLEKLLADDNFFRIEGMNRKIKDGSQMQSDREYAQDKIDFLREECDRRTLLIIDNYDTQYDEMLSELTDEGEYRVLFTSRYYQEEGDYVEIPIEAICEDDALKEIVMGHYGKTYVNIEKSDPAFDELFAITQRHTLTLELIARYMKAKSISSLSRMVEMLRSRGFMGLADKQMRRHGTVNNAYGILRELFSFAELDNEEIGFLKCLCLMADGGVENDDMERWCGQEIFEAKNKLIDRGLIKYDADENMIRMHPLLREIARDKLKPCFEDCKTFLEVFSEEISAVIAWNYTAERKKMYFDCCRSIREVICTVDRENFQIHLQMISFSTFIDSFENSKKILSDLIERAKVLFGKESVQFGKLLHKLAWVNLTFGNQEIALDILENKALPILKKWKECAIGEYVHCCCDIVDVYCDRLRKGMRCREYGKEAEGYLSEVYALVSNEEMIQRYEILKYRRLMVLRRMAQLHQGYQDYRTALQYALEAKERCENMENMELDRCAILTSVEEIYRQLEDYPNAIQCIQTALELSEKYSAMLSSASRQGLRHIQLLSDMAECYEKMNDAKTALQYWDQALEWVDKVCLPQSELYQSVHERYEKSRALNTVQQ